MVAMYIVRLKLVLPILCTLRIAELVYHNHRLVENHQGPHSGAP